MAMNRKRHRAGLAIMAVATALLAFPATAPAKPQRVVSINLCTDQLLLLLAERPAIASVSFLAGDPSLSYVADQASGLRINHGYAEEILSLAPDLVLAGDYGAGPTVALLRARGVPVVQIGLADDFAAIAAQTRTVADALGVPERGAALLAAMDAALATARQAAAEPGASGSAPDAIVYQANGFTAGAGTLADAVLAAAGFRNAAAEAGLSGYGYLPLEHLVTAAPDVLIIDRETDGRMPSLAHALLRHPALASLLNRTAPVRIPRGTMACGGPYTAEAVTALVAARDALPAEAP